MLNTYRLRMNTLGSYEGEARRQNSQKIMDASWMRDAATKPVYVKWVNSGLPIIDDDDFPVYAKFNVKSYHNITGDEIAYLLQFRLEDLKNNPNIKVGSYVQIKNEIDEPEWWIIVHEDDRPQFRQFSILKCLHVYRWVSKVDGKRRIYECLGAPRNQSSYNSGVWLDYTTQVVENQHIAMLPTNDDTRTMMYDTKFLIGDEKRYPPIAWKVSKIQNSLNGDITRFTMTQEQFNPATDNAELMIANYWQSAIAPEVKELEEIPPIDNTEDMYSGHSVTRSGNNATFEPYQNDEPSAILDLEIVYSGNPAVRAGGGFKKFTLKNRVDGKLVDIAGDIQWNIDFAGNDLAKLETNQKDNYLKVKCLNDYSLIGKVFTITATHERSSTSLIGEVISL